MTYFDWFCEQVLHDWKKLWRKEKRDISWLEFLREMEEKTRQDALRLRESESKK